MVRACGLGLQQTDGLVGQPFHCGKTWPAKESNVRGSGYGRTVFINITL
jgi:hypothetical protein